jgi:hypothetical protein
MTIKFEYNVSQNIVLASAKTIFCFLTLCLIFNHQILGQKSINRNCIKFGYGLSLLGHGDLKVINIVNEYERMLTSNFYGSANINFGISNDHNYRKYGMNYLQSNINFSYKLFDFSSKSNMKIGGGVSLLKYSFVSYFDKFLVNDYVLTLGEGAHYISLGYNFIISGEYNINDNFSFSLATIGQFYPKNSNQNLGIFIAAGYHF